MRGAEAVFQEEHHEKPLVLGSEDAVDRLIEALVAGHPSHNMARLFSLDRTPVPAEFPEHEFLVGIDPEEQVGIVAFADADGWFVPSGTAEKEYVTYTLATYPREFWKSPEIPVDLARQAVKEFVLSGGLRPTCIEWQEEPR
ncbi:Imm1 family immunity protein [Streptomyces sp. NRRL WC-3742]|uniref:Imm1 family immunity protein n=1 Tax=Streptomyces sp. NRRL WC-3742 TaxID=1463934 RepID=UPI0004C91DD6|nr:Imm1 family immunity protein [Streptomyces sp. NRRL WC-3742]